MRSFTWLRRKRDYDEVFSTEAGKRVLATLHRLYHMDQPVTVAGDPVSSAFRDGQRSVVCEIERTLSMTPDEIAKLVANAKLAEKEQDE